MAYQIPPDDIVAGDTGHIAAHNDISDVLTGMPAGAASVLNTTWAGGADPTGSADSTAAINAALSGVSPGQPVWLPAGVYKTTGPLIIPPGGVLMGVFANEVTEGSIAQWGSVIQPAASWSQGTCPASGVVVALGQVPGGYSTKSWEQKMWGLFIDCSQLPSGTGPDGISLYGAISRPHLERVLIAHVPGNGVSYLADGSGNTPDALRIERVNVRYPGGYGFYHARISDSTYRDCLVENGGSDGFYIQNASNGAFFGCRAEHNAGNGYTYVCTNSSTGSGGTRFVGCSSDRNEQHGIQLTSTNNSGVPVTLTGCAFRRDGRNGDAGGGGYAGINVTAYPGTVMLAGTAVFPGVDDSGSGALSPQYGLLLNGNNSRTNLIAGASYIQGATTAISDDGSGGQSLYGLDVLAATGGTGSPVVQGPRTGTATLSSGTVTVTCTSVTSSSVILVTRTASSGTEGFLGVSSRSPGASFTVTSSSGTDASEISWQICNP